MADTNLKDTTSPSTTNSKSTANTNTDTTQKTTSSTATTAVSKGVTPTAPPTPTATTAVSKGVTPTTIATPIIDKSNTVNSESSLGDDINTMFKTVFSNSNLILMVWFLAAYLLTYAVIGITQSAETGPLFVLKLIDVVILVCVFIYIFFYYYNIPADKREDKLKNIGSTTYNTLNDPYTLLYTAIFLASYSAIIFVFHIPTSGANAPMSLWLMSLISGILFTVTAIVIFCKSVLGISILDSQVFNNLWNKSADSNTSITSSKVDSTSKSTATATSSSSSSDEVFNVSNNLYTYDDAKAVCSAFESRLATYDEIEDAYTKGGEWCSYGWSEGQMAYFPTQKSTWDKLQKNPKSKNNCGRPGVNGGYMENPYIKFGVNCFGQKPKPSDKDLQSMATNKNIVQPKTEEDLLMEKKVKFWKENADKLLSLNSFNRNKWSEY